MELYWSSGRCWEAELGRWQSCGPGQWLHPQAEITACFQNSRRSPGMRLKCSRSQQPHELETDQACTEQCEHDVENCSPCWQQNRGQQKLSQPFLASGLLMHTPEFWLLRWLYLKYGQFPPKSILASNDPSLWRCHNLVLYVMNHIICLNHNTVIICHVWQHHGLLLMWLFYFRRYLKNRSRTESEFNVNSAGNNKFKLC